MASHSLGITDSMIHYSIIWRNAQRLKDSKKRKKDKARRQKASRLCVENPEKHNAKSIREMKKHASSNKRNRTSMTKNFSLVL